MKSLGNDPFLTPTTNQSKSRSCTRSGYPASVTAISTTLTSPARRLSPAPLIPSAIWLVPSSLAASRALFRFSTARPASRARWSTSRRQQVRTREGPLRLESLLDRAPAVETDLALAAYLTRGKRHERKTRCKHYGCRFTCLSFSPTRAHLSAHQCGAYINMLCAMWRSDDGTLLHDEKLLRRSAKCTCLIGGRPGRQLDRCSTLTASE